MWQSIRILDEIAYLTAKQGFFTPSQVAGQVGISLTTAWRRIAELRQADQVIWLSKGKYKPSNNSWIFAVLVERYAG